MEAVLEPLLFFANGPAGTQATALKSLMRFLGFHLPIWPVLIYSLLAPAASGADYKLKATPATIAWGYYWSAAKPVLHIQSGDTVEIQTLLTNSPDRLAAAGVKPEEIEAELKAIYAEVKDKGPGGHILDRKSVV